MKPVFECVIPGQPVVKKNNQKVVWRNGKPMKINTPAFRLWHANAIKELHLWSRPSVPIDYPVIMQVEFYMRSRRRVDISNLYEGIQDVLSEMNVIMDDSCIVIIGHDGSRVYFDPDNPRMRVKLMRVGAWQPWSSTPANE
ncbi:MAG: RusA family crossover junction endodeoxyribonuclease [Spirochaetes bacterium]|nr:MAG: RusA family crossover junction endodeoxyribonuclease [Spirochaetota bacterium]